MEAETDTQPPVDAGKDKIIPEKDSRDEREEGWTWKMSSSRLGHGEELRGREPWWGSAAMVGGG